MRSVAGDGVVVVVVGVVVGVERRRLPAGSCFLGDDVGVAVDEDGEEGGGGAPPHASRTKSGFSLSSASCFSGHSSVPVPWQPFEIIAGLI